MKHNEAKPPVNMHRIAKLAGVSIGTVSNVINGIVPVGENRRQRVLEAVRAAGYQPSQLARGLRRKSTDMIGMIIPDISNPFFPAIVRGAEDVAYSSSYRLVLCNSDNDPVKEVTYLNQLRSFRPAGIIVIPSVGTRLLSNLTQQDPPIVFADRRPPGWLGDSVVSANEDGAHKATQYLIEMGHKQLAMICGPSELSNAQQRRAGFERALADAGIAIQQWYMQEGRFNLATGSICMKRLLELHPRPTAVFTANDLMAAGALLAIRDSGLHCPQEISLFSFDNLDFAEFTHPPLSTVHQPGYQMGSTATRLLLDRIQAPVSQSRKVVLETELRLRYSVSRPATTAAAKSRTQTSRRAKLRVQA